MSRSAIALNRFGLGARLEDRPPDDPEAWLRAQFDRYEVRPAPIAAAPGRDAVVDNLAGSIEAMRNVGRNSENTEGMAASEAGMTGRAIRRTVRRAARDYYAEMVAARTNAALITPTPFLERLVHFWSNHFAVSANDLMVVGLAGLLEFDVVRPHLLGRFEDLLLAAERHPAMLFYLDQVQSMGPGSLAATRAARRRPDGPRRGLNENLAREILELHTLGADGGYSQADVTEFARALTGWSAHGIIRQHRIARFLDADGEPGSFAFASALHEPGARQVLGRRYEEGGEEQGRAILADLARHPSTARHLATKLARHFAGDEPPRTLVDRLDRAYQASDGDLAAVYRALIESPEAWVEQPVKFRSPSDWLLAAFRATGTRELEPAVAVATPTQLGQPVWRPGSPAGFDDLSARWAGPDALVRRVELAGQIARQAGDRIDPRALAPRLFPGQLSESTARSIAGSESESQGLALLLVSPEFQRR
ncbi:MAG: DUF1800 domain-containing protein [Sphingomonadales bacterium]|nr:DUF1800 domain-containing protein [Sphingomonadales bacterium]